MNSFGENINESLESHVAKSLIGNNSADLRYFIKNIIEKYPKHPNIEQWKMLYLIWLTIYDPIDARKYVGTSGMKNKTTALSMINHALYLDVRELSNLSGHIASLYDSPMISKSLSKLIMHSSKRYNSNDYR